MIISPGKFASLVWLPWGCDTEQQLAAPPQPQEKRLKQVLGKAVTGGGETQTVRDMICEDERHKIRDFYFFLSWNL